MEERIVYQPCDRQAFLPAGGSCIANRFLLGLRSFRAEAASEGRWRVLIRAGAVPAEAGLALRQFATLIDVRDARIRDDDQATF